MGGHTEGRNCCPKQYWCMFKVCQTAPGCFTLLIAKYAVDRKKPRLSCLGGTQCCVGASRVWAALLLQGMDGLLSLT